MYLDATKVPVTLFVWKINLDVPEAIPIPDHAIMARCESSIPDQRYKVMSKNMKNKKYDSVGTNK